MTDQTIDPRTLPTSDTVRREILPDGTVLLVRANPASPAVVMRGLALGGSADDPADRPGIARFVAETISRGTTTRSAHELYETAESVGAGFGFSGGLHSLRFGAKCLAEDTETLVDLLADILQNPSFPMEEIERVRGETLTELEEQQHSTRYITERTYRELAFPSGHPYARPSMGTTESVAAISRDDLRAFYELALPRRPMIIAVVGQVDSDAVVGLISEYWRRWPGGRRSAAPDIPDTVAPAAPARRHVEVPGKVQIDLAWGGVGPRRSDDDYLAAGLANVVLGGFGLMGRLGATVREQQGLAYYATSRLSGGLGQGPWQCLAGVAPHHFQQAVDTIRDEVERLRSEPVPDEEFDDCKSYLTGSLPLKLESNEGIANIMIDIELHGLGWDYLLHFPEDVMSMAKTDVMNAARRYLDPETRVLASSGPEVTS